MSFTEEELAEIRRADKEIDRHDAEKRREARRRYYRKHHDKILAYQRNWNDANRERKREIARSYYWRNKDEINTRRRKEKTV